MQIKPLWLLLILGVWFAAAQGQDVFTLTADSLQNGQAVELDKLGWKYLPDSLANDDPRFADPQFDDRAWATLASSAKPQDTSGWRGIGWFRLHLRVAPELANVALNLEMTHLGASEVYVNGKLIKRFGVVGKTLAEETAYNPNALPLLVVLQAGTEQLIAVRYSNQQGADDRSVLAKWMLAWDAPNPFGWGGIGFKSRIRVFDAAASQHRMGYGVWPFSFGFLVTQTTAFLSFGILHLLLFAFLARQRTNLFYGLFLLGLGLNALIIIEFFSAHHGVIEFYLLITWALPFTWFGSIVSLIGFLHSAFTPGLPRRMWLFLAGALFMVFAGVWQLKSWLILGNLILAVYALEIVRIMVGAIRRQLPGARIVATGLLLLSLTLAQSFLTTPNMLTYGLGLFGMILALSIYLAREYAHTNEYLADQLVQVKQLSAAALEHEKVKAENERRAQELEEARQLQLSMLPKKLPSLPHLDIAAYMKTASEVGGDYYDFHLGEDGTLTIAVGDATGHGLKAGTMVASVKSLFMTLAYHPDITHIFSRLNQTLKQMQLRGLFMAMTIAKVKGNQLTISIAGMPPVWIYRAANQQIEEVMLKQLPLGGIAKYTYQQRECSLHSGDVIVLMSDGLPEGFNEANEMLEDESAQRFVMENANLSSQEIINGLVKLGDDWGGARPQDDDVTFVVVKYVECGRLDAAFRS